MSEVKTERIEESRDSDGHTTRDYVTVFQGIYGFVNIQKAMLPYFEISTNNFFAKYAKSRVEVDSSNFEKYYDLYTQDKVHTMEIFTAELIDEFNKVIEELKNPIQVKVQNGMLYFRMKMKDSFEVSTFGKALDFDVLYHDFKLIDMPMRLISKILEHAKFANQ